ncbi:MAG TPA: cytochrome c [Flavobacteriales bacterium]|nr:cytochrome c [Flavobacteriales bacterium]
MIKYIAIALVLVVISCGEEAGEASEKDNLPKEELTVEQKVEAGKTLYMSNCKLCHGEDGTLGNSGSKNLQETKLAGKDLINVISYGQNAMRGYKDFFEEGDIDNIAAFVETLKKN